MASTVNQLAKQEEVAFRKVKQSLESQLHRLNLSDSEKYIYYTEFYSKLKTLNIFYYRKEALEKIISLDVKEDKRPYVIDLAALYHSTDNHMGLSRVTALLKRPSKIATFQDSLVTFFKLKQSGKLSSNYLKHHEVKSLNNFGLSEDVVNHNISIFVKRAEYEFALKEFQKIKNRNTLSRISHIVLSRLSKKKSKYCNGKDLRLIKDICRLKDEEGLTNYIERFEKVYPENFMVRNLIYELHRGSN